MFNPDLLPGIKTLRARAEVYAESESVTDAFDQEIGFPWGAYLSDFTAYTDTFTAALSPSKLEARMFEISRQRSLRVLDLMGPGFVFCSNIFHELSSEYPLQAVALTLTDPLQKTIRYDLPVNSSLKIINSVPEVPHRGNILYQETWDELADDSRQVGGFDFILNRARAGFRWVYETFGKHKENHTVYPFMAAASDLLANGGILLSDSMCYDTRPDRKLMKAHLYEYKNDRSRLDLFCFNRLVLGVQRNPVSF